MVWVLGGFSRGKTPSHRILYDSKIRKSLRKGVCRFHIETKSICVKILAPSKHFERSGRSRRWGADSWYESGSLRLGFCGEITTVKEYTRLVETDSGGKWGHKSDIFIVRRCG